MSFCSERSTFIRFGKQCFTYWLHKTTFLFFLYFLFATSSSLCPVLQHPYRDSRCAPEHGLLPSVRCHRWATNRQGASVPLRSSPRGAWVRDPQSEWTSSCFPAPRDVPSCCFPQPCLTSALLTMCLFSKLVSEPSFHVLCGYRFFLNVT